MFRVTRYPMISKTESGRVGYRNKYRVAGRVRVPAGHWMPAMQHCRGWVGCIVPVIDPVRFLTCVSGFVKYLYLDLSSYLELRVGDCESDINQCCYSHFWKYHYFLFLDCVVMLNRKWLLQIMLQKQFIFPWLKCVLYCLFRSATIKATKYYDSLTPKKNLDAVHSSLPY